MSRMLVRKADRGRSHAACGRIASEVREVLGFNSTERIDGCKLFESLDKYRIGHAGSHLEMSYAVDALPTGVEAHTRYDEGGKRLLVTLSEATYLALEQDGGSRALFTLAHEIGHAVMHAGQLVRLIEFKHDAALAGLNRGAPKHEIWEDTEFQADSFAGSLLVPAEAVRAKMLTTGARAPGTLGAFAAQYRIVTELANEYGVSHPCASIQVDLFRRGKLR